MKFGGSSVDGAARMLAAGEIVARRAEEAPVIVTSAMRGVTDTLLSLVEVATGGDRARLDAAVASLGERHLVAAREIAADDDALAGRLTERLRDVRVLLRGMRIVSRATPPSVDALLGQGELLAQELLVAALERAGVRAVLVDARRVVVTDDRFGAARPDLDATTERARSIVAPRSAEGAIPVLGGYVGATPDGTPTTLGRGGSDLSASILGLALAARAIEIWTDVDGLLSADPRQVPDARVLERVTFREAAELAGFGARVLHPASIDPAIRGGIRVVVRNTLAPAARGTEIGPQPDAVGIRVAAVGLLEGVGVVRVRAPGLSRDPGHLPRLLADLAATDAPALALVAGPVGVDLLLDAAAGREAAISASLRPHGEVGAVVPRSIVALVGEGIASRPVTWGPLAEMCADLEAPWLVHGPHGASIGLVVPPDRAPELARTLHRELVVVQERTAGGRDA